MGEPSSSGGAPPHAAPILRSGLLLAAVLAVGAVGPLPAAQAGGGPTEDERRALYLKNPLFTSIHPQYRETDPSGLIRLDGKEELEAKRRSLVRLAFGADRIPTGLMATVSERSLDDPAWSRLPALARLDALHHLMEHGVDSAMYYFHAKGPCDRLAIYHEGHGQDFAKNATIIERLLETGYDVIALNMPVTGRNRAPVVDLEGVGRILLDNHAWFAFLERPLHFFLEPVAAAVNLALEEKEYEEVVMIGLSGGGWATTVYAAMDSRIQRSYPVAGSAPMYLRSSTPDRVERRPGDFEQLLPDLIRTANYLEMYVMGASGPGRRQLQVINRFDRVVPFHGVKHETYMPAVREAVARLGPGEFEVLLDDGVDSHGIHPETLRRILDELAPGCREGGAGKAGAEGHAAPGQTAAPGDRPSSK